MNTVNQQPVTQKPGLEERKPIAASLKLKGRPLDYKRNTPELIRRVKVYSADRHYPSLQIAIEDGIDAWARHAAASNGFCDLI